ncbi:RICIN domain-containing protein [Streptomyces sp. NPDC002755]|uniref:RICIN domain-containing protein n=1 Tax=Streptomyces sp. NPDC002884 TaxID=3154544 RepID=UPI003332B222
MYEEHKRMPELPKRDVAQRVKSQPERHSGDSDAAKLTAARAALARAAAAHRSSAEVVDGTTHPRPRSRPGRLEEPTTAPPATNDAQRRGPRRAGGWIIASAAVLIVAAVATTIAVSGRSGAEQTGRPPYDLADELRRSSVTDGESFGAGHSAGASGDAALLPSDTASASVSGPASKTETHPDDAKNSPRAGTAAGEGGARDEGGDSEDGDAATQPETALVVESGGTCLTGSEAGSELSVAACGSASAQSWSISSDRNLNQGGLCASITGTKDRAPVILRPCDQSAEQEFGLVGSSLVSAASGKCLDVFGGASGTQVVLWECNGRDNQRWSTS